MIEPAQIRAARALLDWTIEDLATASGLNKDSIKNAERSHTQPRTTTMAAIRDALERSGVVFTEGSGVKKKSDLVEILEGDDCYLRLLDQFMIMKIDGEKEILFSGANERRSSEDVINKSKQLIERDFSFRFLLEQSDSYIMGNLDWYRWIDREYFSPGDVKLICGDVVAYLISWTEKMKIILIRDKYISDENRRVFNYIWDNGVKPTHTIADKFY